MLTTIKQLLNNIFCRNDDDDRRGNRRMGGFRKGNGVASPPMAGGG